MQFGRWIPISKNVKSLLPNDRPFSELEALVSLQLDYDQNATVTVQGYAQLWGWSRGKVSRFLEKVGASIQYPKNTAKKQNQRGQIVIQITDRSKAKSEQIRVIDSRYLDGKVDRSEVESGQKTDRSRVTTKDPDTDPKSLSAFSDDAYRLSALLAKLILQNNQLNRSLQPDRFDRSVQSWAEDIDRMLRLDGRSVEEAERVIRWSQKDSFWRANILSGKKLRDKYDQLVLQMNKPGPERTQSLKQSDSPYRSYECR